ncbi:MAG: hypothetical protein R3307_01735 [Anaerolineales bacterium]|nr:hypothetical protein [Anaerolineales bacterium]
MYLIFTLFSVIGPLRPPEYLGPETLMPLASILAAIAGFFLMFWRLIVKFFRTTYRKIRGLPDEEIPPDMDEEDSFEDEMDT